MKLMKFNNGVFSPIKASLITIKGKEHYNIKHGTRLKDGWEVTIGVDDNIVREYLKESISMIEMDSDEYILLPIINKSKNEHVTDGLGNKKYFVSINSSARSSDVLLFINLPTVGEDIKYTLYGNSRLLNIAKDLVFNNSDDPVVIDAPIVLMESVSSILIQYVRDGILIKETIRCANGHLTHNIEETQTTEETQ